MSNRALSTAATILVVEDDLVIATLLEELLSDEGYLVRLASSLAAAIDVIEVEELDTILLDVQLPDGSGFDLCARLQSNPQTADVPILLLSGIDRSSKFVAHGLDLGGYDFLPKPFYNDELLARVRVLIRLRTMQKRLIEQERDRAMLATAGAAAHNLGQPLTAAMGLVRMLLDTELSAAQRQDLEMMQTALRQMSEIVKQIQGVQHYITQPYLDGASSIEILDLEQARGERPS
ncbi:MAG TPA: response regulator [Herpetosiphonaceae bacterium]